ncbi:MAG: sialidase family protein [Caldilineaceae bacterium]
MEPPDQALCVGNGYTLEAVNSVLRVYDSASGAPLSGVQDINTFFGYPAAINRTTFEFGPNVIDPVCYYDPDHQRFIVVITTLDSDLGGNFAGRNTIDIAVSNSGDPTGAWTIYYIPAHNDGTENTPNHGCTLDGANPGPCFQDYPYIAPTNMAYM